jgi:hypothetical protein
MRDLPRFEQNVLRWNIFVVGEVWVDVLPLTGLPQNLFGCATEIRWLALIGGEVGGRNVLEQDLARFF